MINCPPVKRFFYPTVEFTAQKGAVTAKKRDFLCIRKTFGLSQSVGFGRVGSIVEIRLCQMKVGPQADFDRERSKRRMPQRLKFQLLKPIVGQYHKFARGGPVVAQQSASDLFPGRYQGDRNGSGGISANWRGSFIGGAPLHSFGGLCKSARFPERRSWISRLHLRCAIGFVHGR